MYVPSKIVVVALAAALGATPGAALAAWPANGTALCTAPNSQSDTQIIPDGSGGAIVCWVDIRHGLNYNQDIYAQRVNAAGVPLWAADGVAVCTAPNAQDSPHMISDGAGGAILCWVDIRHGLNYNQDLYAQRISAAGTPMWTADGVAVCTAPFAQQQHEIVADDAGGIIVCWEDGRTGNNTDPNIYAQRVSAAGVPLWTADGVALCTAANAQDGQKIVADGLSGVIACWMDIRHGNNFNRDLYAQRVSAAGLPLWTPNGVAVCTAANTQDNEKIVADGANGVIVAWEDLRTGNNFDPNLYAQRVSAAGAPLWTTDGVTVCTAPNSQSDLQSLSDGAGGVITCWVDIRHGLNYNQDLYAQRLNGTGSPLWAVDGVAVCTAPNAQQAPQVVSDGANGIIVCWDDIRHGLNYNNDLYVQRIGAAGAPLWTIDGVAVCTAPNAQVSARIVTDGASGALLSWMDFRLGLNYNPDLYAQSVDAAGTPQCAPNGVALCTAPDTQDNLKMVSDGTGGAIASWEDLRLGLNYNPDVYAQKLCQCTVGGTCTVPVTVSDLEATTAGGFVELRWQAGFTGGDAAIEVWRSMDERGPFERISPAFAVPSVPESMTFRDEDVRPGSTYWYEIVRADAKLAVLAGPIRVTTAAAALELHVAGSSLAGGLQVEYQVPVRGRVRIELFAVSGRKLRTLLDARREAGRGRLDFDGRDLASGVYLLRLRSTAGTLTRRAILMH